MSADLRALTELFARLGARDPEGWARSQLDEGINQLGRYLFLRQAWRLVVAESDHSWIDEILASDPKKPGGGAVSALERLLGEGAVREDLTEVVRVMQWKLLFSFCYLLEDPGDTDVDGFAWGLFQTEEDGEPTDPIIGLHESVLEMDPTGREMRPR
jgi:hypothetical protein